MKKLGWIALAAVTLLFWPVVVYTAEYFDIRIPIKRASEIDKRKGR